MATTGAPMRAADFSENAGIVDDEESVDACSRDDEDAGDADGKARLALISAAPGRIGTSVGLPRHRRPTGGETARDIDMVDIVRIRGTTSRVTELRGRDT